jgi:aspartate ammonia-lyase
MPGKVNPVIPEFVLQLSMRIHAAETTVAEAVAMGELELDVMTPTITLSPHEMLTALTLSASVLAERCVARLQWQCGRVEQNRRGSRREAVELAHREGHVLSERQHPIDYPPL